MKTNSVPAVIMLTAGLIDCIISICYHLTLGEFLKQLLIVLIIFYLIGCVVKIIIDCNFKEMEVTQEEAAEEEENPKTESDEAEMEKDMEEEGNKPGENDLNNEDSE